MKTRINEGFHVSDIESATEQSVNQEPNSAGKTAARRPHSPFLPSEGIKMTLLEEGLLDGAGVLRGGRPSVQAYGLPESALELFLTVASAMPHGLPRSRVPKHLSKDLDGHLLPLEVQTLVEWQRDARGRQTHLVLTWKGQDTLDAARPKPATSWAARRRSQIQSN